MTATHFDRSTQDVGNVLGLEHVNLVIPDRDIGDRFYVSALGFTRDSYVDLGLFGVSWVNLGSQQLHLVHGTDAQVLRGVIGLAVPDPDAVATRLTRLLEKFEPMAATSAACVADGDGYLVTCPWGNRFRIHGPDDFEHMPVGMPYVEINTAPGTAAGIAAFYQQVLGANTSLDEADGRVKATVHIGRHQQLHFVETGEPIAEYDGHHIAVYLHNFSEPYEWLLERELVTRETDAHEYRFQDIVDPANGKVCSVIEHEVRSMFHPMFGRELINRDASQRIGARYRPGHDALPGLHSGGVG